METERKVTRTRIIPPRRRSDLLTRSRLINLLNDLVEKKLILVTAPAGYGKTSLLIDFATQTELPVCWYAIDVEDRNPQRFLAHLIASIRLKFPMFGEMSGAAMNSAAPGQFDLNELITPLVNDVYENIQEHFIIILDDFHLVEGSKSITSFISRFCQESDEACHVIIASRILVTLPDLMLMVARTQVDGLDYEALAFRPDEIQALAMQNYQRVISDSLAQQLVELSEGWVTGLLLSKSLSSSDNLTQIRVARASGTGLNEYFNELLLSQPVSIQKFLVFSSLMDEFDADLCREVLADLLSSPGESWEPQFGDILRLNLFVLPVGDEGLWLRYHHLFRDYLQAKLAREYAEIVPVIKRKLASVCFKRGDWERAFRFYADIDEQEALLGIIEQAGPLMISSGRWDVVETWFNTLSPGVLADRPRAIALQAYLAMLLGEASRALRLFEIAIPALRTNGPPDQFILALVRRSGSLRLQGKYEAAMVDAREALEVTDQGGATPYLRAETSRAIGLVYYQEGELKAAQEWLNQALMALQSSGNEETLAKLLVDVGLVEYLLGNYSTAKETYRRALDKLQDTTNYAWQASLYNNLGMLQSLLGEYEEAVEDLEKALDYARMGSDLRMQAFALASIGDLYQILEAYEEALEAYRRARSIAEKVKEGKLLIEIDLGEINVAGRQGEYVVAVERLEQILDRARLIQSPAELAACQVAKGYLLIRQDRFAEAIQVLKEAASYYEHKSDSIAAARSQFFLAAAFSNAGALFDAYPILQKGLSWIKDLENFAYAAVLGRQVLPGLEKIQTYMPGDSVLQALMIEIKTFARTLAGLRRRIRSKAAVVPIASARMHIYALGSMTVEVDQHQVSGSDWGSDFARDFFYLLLTHPGGLSREAIEVSLWPDASDSELKYRFKNNIYRLRRALGQDVILLKDDKYYFNSGLDYEYDVERYHKALEQVLASTKLIEKLEYYQVAMNLYKGSFLPQAGGTWVVAERERLAMGHLEALMTMADLYLQGQQYTKALNCCLRALAEDNCNEAVYQKIMRIYARLGNRAAITRQFKRCQQALKKEINMAPSAETTALYLSLMH